MKVVIQRVHSASVKVEQCEISKIKYGLLIFLCVEKNDSDRDINYLINKVINIRIFKDNNKNMNLSLNDIGGEVLVVSQFTLCANTKRGRRPSFENAETPSVAKHLFNEFCNNLEGLKINVETGKFAEMMDVELNNDGPITILLDSKDRL